MSLTGSSKSCGFDLHFADVQVALAVCPRRNSTTQHPSCNVKRLGCRCLKGTTLIVSKKCFSSLEKGDVGRMLFIFVPCSTETGSVKDGGGTGRRKSRLRSQARQSTCFASVGQLCGSRRGPRICPLKGGSSGNVHLNHSRQCVPCSEVRSGRPAHPANTSNEDVSRPWCRVTVGVL